MPETQAFKTVDVSLTFAVSVPASTHDYFPTVEKELHASAERVAALLHGALGQPTAHTWERRHG